MLAPWPMLTMAMTAATPMMMPRVVRSERMALRRNARSAILIVISSRCMRASLERPPWAETGWRGGGRFSACDDAGDHLLPLAETAREHLGERVVGDPSREGDRLWRAVGITNPHPTRPPLSSAPIALSIGI